jgi:hypothetical protein
MGIVREVAHAVIYSTIILKERKSTDFYTRSNSSWGRKSHGGRTRSSPGWSWRSHGGRTRCVCRLESILLVGSRLADTTSPAVFSTGSGTASVLPIEGESCHTGRRR